ncbi:MAG: hypothetical protein NVS9B7_27320 [Flavisolibacter sp.]
MFSSCKKESQFKKEAQFMETKEISISGVQTIETNSNDLLSSGIVTSIIKAPVSADGLVSGRPTEFVVNFNTSMDPKVPGRSLLAGKKIKITLPKAFISDGRPIAEFGTASLASINSAAVLQGWPQNPINFTKFQLSYDEEDANTIVIMANSDAGPVDQQNPGIKQVHMIIRGFTNPDPGIYQINVKAETGPDGSLETGMAEAEVLAQNRPNINYTSAFDNPPPRKNKIYQETTPGALTPLPMDFLVWDRSGNPFNGIEIRPLPNEGDNEGDAALIVQGDKVVGKVFIQSPSGATGQLVYTEATSKPVIAPVTKLPSSLFRAFFKAGSATGDYILTFSLNGGNDIKTFVSVHN